MNKFITIAIFLSCALSYARDIRKTERGQYVGISRYQDRNGEQKGQGVLFDAPLTANTIDLITGDVGAYSNWGPTWCWNRISPSVVLQEKADDVPQFGCIIPTGQTGAGSGGSCLFSHNYGEWYPKNTRDFNYSWTQIGTNVVLTTTHNWLSGGEQMYRIVDDTTSAHEGISQVVSKLYTSSWASIAIDAATESGTTTMTVKIQEQTGAGCSPPVHLGEVRTVTTTPTRFTFLKALNNTSCREVKLTIYPVDATGPTVTTRGAVAALVNMIQSNTKLAGGIYIDMGTSTRFAGGGQIDYDASKILKPHWNGLVDIEFDIMRFYSVGERAVPFIFQTGIFADDVYVYDLQSQWRIYLSNAGYWTMNVAGHTPADYTVGQWYPIKIEMDYVNDVYTWYEDGVQIDQDTSPHDAPVVTDLKLDALIGMFGGGCMRNIKVTQY